MRERLHSFNYIVPQTFEEVTHYLSTLDEACLLAGGTDLIVAMKLKGLRPKNIISLKNFKNMLSYIIEEKEYIRIGALTTFHDLETSLLISEKFKVLHEAIQQIAFYQIKNIATIGGNLCNASPAADSAPPLMVLNAQLVIIGPNGERRIPIDKFFIGPGKTVLSKGEFLKEIIIPYMPESSGAAYIKLGRRRGIDISVVSSTAFVRLDGELIVDSRIALGSVAPTPTRAHNAERILKGKKTSRKHIIEASEKVVEDINPITDVRASAEYRREMAKVLTAKALQIAIKRAGGEIYED
jgi:carbon-monoxide dehydrogenase medium subunit